MNYCFMFSDVPIWDISMFDTYENVDPRPELTMKPVAMFPCPFRKGKNKIVLCEFYDKERVPRKLLSHGMRFPTI